MPLTQCLAGHNQADACGHRPDREGYIAVVTLLQTFIPKGQTTSGSCT